MISALAALSLLATARAATHQVTVGGAAPNTLLFQPEALSAAIGDVVEFTFKQKNHTVTQTSFGNVCHPLLDAYQAAVFDTGFQPVAAEAADGFPVVSYTVGVDTPLWFYCAQTSHCGKGMVFSINCPYEGANSFDNFKQSAIAYGVEQEAAAAASSAWQATATSEVHNGYTYAPVYHPTVTETVTLGEEVWTTTYESYANSPDPTPDAPQGVEHVVIVGGEGSLTYNPPAIAAAVRDTVKFVFTSKNHTVTQSSFFDPCRKLELTSLSGQVGFDSGFIPVAAGTTEDAFPSYTLTVNDTAPIWAYCRQGTHCGAGMAFSINADESSEKNHAAFVALAKTLNGTAAAPAPSSGEITGEGSAAPSVRVGAASAVLLAVGSIFVLAF